MVERRKTSGHNFVDRVFCITTRGIGILPVVLTDDKREARPTTKTHSAAGSEYMANDRKVQRVRVPPR